MFVSPQEYHFSWDLVNASILIWSPTIIATKVWLKIQNETTQHSQQIGISCIYLFIYFNFWQCIQWIYFTKSLLCISEEANSVVDSHLAKKIALMFMLIEAKSMLQLAYARDFPELFLIARKFDYEINICPFHWHLHYMDSVIVSSPHGSWAGNMNHPIPTPLLLCDT